MKRGRANSKPKDLSGFQREATAPIIKRTFLNVVRLERDLISSFDQYPFSVPAIRHLHRMEFHPAVTFFIGENGSGKSTLLEAIALKFGFNPEGGGRELNFSTHDTHSPLHECLRVERGVGRATDGFSLRAESFYNVATELEKIEKDIPAVIPYRAYGGKSLHAQSHG
jgi:predicted ATPase